MNKEWQPEEKLKDSEETWFCEHADVLDCHDDQLYEQTEYRPMFSVTDPDK